jgi:hypothetical protein
MSTQLSPESDSTFTSAELPVNYLAAAPSTASAPSKRSARSARSARSIGLSRNERGEGVISMAIAVLIMAALGAILFGIYKTSFVKSAERSGKMVETITEAP